MKLKSTIHLSLHSPIPSIVLGPTFPTFLQSNFLQLVDSLAVNGLVIVGHWFVASLVEATINQTLSRVWRRKDEDEAHERTRRTGRRGERKSSGVEGQGVAGEDGGREQYFKRRSDRAGPSLLRRPLTRITVASPATLKRWTSRRGRRQGRLFRRRRRAAKSLRLYRTDWSPWPRLPFAGDVPAHPRPGLSDISGPRPPRS